MTKRLKEHSKKSHGTHWPVGLCGPRRQVSVHLGQRHDELTIIIRIQSKRSDGSNGSVLELELPPELENNLVNALKAAGRTIRSVPSLNRWKDHT